MSLMNIATKVGIIIAVFVLVIATFAYSSAATAIGTLGSVATGNPWVVLVAPLVFLTMIYGIYRVGSEF